MHVLPPPDAVPAALLATAPPPGTRLPRHYDGCFACGDAQTAGLHLDAVVGDGVTVDATFTVTRAHQGAPGLAHGGLLATAIDESMGFLFFLTGDPAVTAHLEIDYRRPVPVGTEVRVRAAVLGRIGRKIWASATGTLPDGKVAFSGGALFLVVPVEHFEKHAGRNGVGAAIEARYNP